jgi:hypothetical protein
MFLKYISHSLRAAHTVFPLFEFNLFNRRVSQSSYVLTLHQLLQNLLMFIAIFPSCTNHENCYTPSLPHLFQHFCLVLKLLLFPPHPVHAKVEHSLVSWSHLNLVWDPEQVPVSSAKLKEFMWWRFLTPSSLLSFLNHFWY